MDNEISSGGCPIIEEEKKSKLHTEYESEDIIESEGEDKDKDKDKDKGERLTSKDMLIKKVEETHTKKKKKTKIQKARPPSIIEDDP